MVVQHDVGQDKFYLNVYWADTSRTGDRTSWTRQPRPYGRTDRVLFPILVTWRFTIIVSNVRNGFARWERMYETSVGHDHSKSSGAEDGKQYTL